MRPFCPFIAFSIEDRKHSDCDWSPFNMDALHITCLLLLLQQLNIKMLPALNIILLSHLDFIH